MNKLHEWVAFESVALLVSLSALAACIIGAHHFFSNLYAFDPLVSFGRAILGILIGLHGCGHIMAIILIIMMAKEINPEVAREQLQLISRKWKTDYPRLNWVQKSAYPALFYYIIFYFITSNKDWSLTSLNTINLSPDE